MTSRCPWAESSAVMRAYHDSEWGVPVHDDRTFFEFLILEGAQAGLSWATVLNKRDRYRDCFAGFDPQAVARFSERKISDLLSDPGLIRNRLKIAGAVSNARAFVRVQEDFGSFDAYVWRFVDGTPVVNAWTSQDQVPSSTKLSDRVAADLKRRGFRFVGTTICYSFLQATGIVDDHLTTCFRKLQPVKGTSQS